MKYFAKSKYGHKVYYYKSFKIVRLKEDNEAGSFPPCLIFKGDEEEPCGFASGVATAIDFIKEGKFNS